MDWNFDRFATMLAPLGHYVYIFFSRHWALALVNVTMTVLLCAGVLKFARRFYGLSSQAHLQWMRFVLFVSLCKGALYLVLGHNRGSTVEIVEGVQMPDPFEFLCLVPQTRDSIWHPTQAMVLVSILMGSIALYLLFKRAHRVWVATKALAGVALLSGPPQPRITQALEQAAHALGFSDKAKLPTVLLVELEYATPLLLGIVRPTLLLAPSLANTLSDGELQALFRHELAHLKRRDHWARWLMLWVQDVGRLNPLSYYLTLETVSIEEQLCDRMATRTAKEALELANAINHAKHTAGAAKALPQANFPKDVVPAFLGNFGKPEFEAESLVKRINSLLSLATELNISEGKGTAQIPKIVRITQSIGIGWTRFFLCFILYLKFIYVLNLPRLW